MAPYYFLVAGGTDPVLVSFVSGATDLPEIGANARLITHSPCFIIFQAARQDALKFVSRPDLGEISDTQTKGTSWVREARKWISATRLSMKKLAKYQREMRIALNQIGKNEMKISFCQIYIKPGVSFPFSHHFQNYISENISEIVDSSSQFISSYGNDFELIFNISAKNGIIDYEVKGPTVFRKTKDVEYSIFLPFDVIVQSTQVHKCALQFLLNGVCEVLQNLGFKTDKIMDSQEAMIEKICSDPIMFKKAR